MENLLKRKLRIGISACQFGSKVRYNGKGIDLTQCLGRDRGQFIWTPVCPEIMSGMGVPRASIKLSGGDGFDFWRGKAIIKNKEGKNKSEVIKSGAHACLETLERANIDAYIFMEGSPSCGVYRTSLKNQRLGNPPGVFGALLLDRNIFLISSVDLQSPIRWWDWKRRLVAFVWVKEQNICSKDSLKEIWDKIKYVLYELHEEETTKLKNKFHEVLKKEAIDNVEFNKIKEDFLTLLRKPAEIENIKKYLWKNYIDLKNKEGIIVENVFEPHILRNMTHIAEELLGVEKEARKANLFFKSSPINYKPDR
ncbi:DUF523 domain-containing protein [uncultured Cetobacterium sp.]|uniref:DUF523 domain-containing protein n=1 Tax=uncultured Cetobacterium sp. TaxID=527638 RepID=UPI00262FE69B|nr:DUF523 domain-containing protein [uncultured Cetobacterium sp.]